MDVKTELPDPALLAAHRDALAPPMPVPVRSSVQVDRASSGRRRACLPPTPEQLKALGQELSSNREGLLKHAVDLVRRGRRHHGELPGGDQAEDLLQQASLLLTSGKRSWPANIEAIIVLKMAMLQLAGNRWRSPAAREVSLDWIIEGPVEHDREESESDSDTLDLMEAGGSDFVWTGSDDEEVSDPGDVPDLGGSDLYRLDPAELYARKAREQEILEQADSALEDEPLGKEIVRSILGGCRKTREIADDLGSTIRETHHTLRRVKRKLQPFRPEWKSP